MEAKLSLLCLTVAVIFSSISGLSYEEDPEVEVVCETHDAYIPHPDCTKYYQCVNFIPTERSCPAEGSLYWNPRTNVCDYPETVPECVGGTRPPTDSTTTTAVPSSTSVTEEPTTTPAQPDPTTAEPTAAPTTTTEKVETTTEADYPTTDEPEDPTTEEPENPSTAEPEQPTTTTTEKVETTTQEQTNPTTEQTPICHPAGYYMLPIPGNCTAFIICAYGKIYYDVCAKGLKFDPVIRKCMLEELVDCEDPTPPPTTQPTTTEAPVCTQPGYYLKPYPGSCTLYYACTDYIATVLECAPGLLFDPFALTCVRAEASNCTVPTEPPTPTETPATSAVPPTTEDWQETDGPGDETTTDDWEGTDGPGDETTTDDWEGTDGPAYETTTDDWQGTDGPGDETTTDDWQGTDGPSDGTTTDEDDEPPSTTDASNPETEEPATETVSDNSTTTTTTTRRPGPRCDPDRNYYIPYEGDTSCTYYVHCSYGVPILLSCAEGTLFDPDVQKCVRAEYYTCPYATPQPTSSEPAPPSTTEPAPPESTTVERFPCPSEPYIVYMPHDEQCNLFYLCIEGNFRGVLSCGNEHWFSYVQQGCVRPQDSECELEELP